MPNVDREYQFCSINEFVLESRNDFIARFNFVHLNNVSILKQSTIRHGNERMR